MVVNGTELAKTTFKNDVMKSDAKQSSPSSSPEATPVHSSRASKG